VNLCHVYPIAAITAGRQGEKLLDFAQLKQAGTVAFSDDGDGVEDDAIMREALLQTGRTDTIITAHCEFKQLSRRGVMHDGPTCQRLGLRGYPPVGEEAMIERDLALLAETGGRYHVAHVSTAKGVEMIRQARRRGRAVTAEVCTHHLLLCDEDVVGPDGRPDANFKMSPPLRGKSDVAACVEGVRDGTIDCIVTDHAPHTASEKAVGFDAAPMGIVGLETSLGCAARALMTDSGFGWYELIERMSTAPARVLRLSGGTLTDRSPADITIIDPKREWTVDAARFASRSRNTPFDGWQLIGKVIATIVNGRLVWSENTQHII